MLQRRCRLPSVREWAALLLLGEKQYKKVMSDTPHFHHVSLKTWSHVFLLFTAWAVRSGLCTCVCVCVCVDTLHPGRLQLTASHLAEATVNNARSTPVQVCRHLGRQQKIKQIIQNNRKAQNAIIAPFHCSTTALLLNMDTDFCGSVIHLPLSSPSSLSSPSLFSSSLSFLSRPISSSLPCDSFPPLSFSSVGSSLPELSSGCKQRQKRSIKRNGIAKDKFGCEESRLLHSILECSVRNELMCHFFLTVIRRTGKKSTPGKKACSVWSVSEWNSRDVFLLRRCLSSPWS